MATSGRIESNAWTSPSGSSTAKTYLAWSVVSQDVSANSTLISVSAGWVGSGLPSFGSNAVKITDGKVNGSSIPTGTWSGQNGAGDHQLVTWTQTITHNPDGTKNFAASIQGWFYLSTNTTASGSWDLPTIPRASGVSVISPSLAIGGSQAVTISRASSSFTHKVELVINGTVLATQTGVATSAAVVIPTTAAAQIPNAVSGTAYIRVTTMSGSTQIGDPKQAAFSVTIPDTATYQPAFTASIVRVDGIVPAAWGIYVQTFSSGKVTVSSPVPGSGASLSSWAVDGPLQHYAGTPSEWTWTSDKIQSSGAVVVDVTVTDSRGRSTTQTIPITVEPYGVPVITGSAYRSNASGTADDDAGTYLAFQGSASISSCAGKNGIAGSARLVAWSIDGGVTWVGKGTWTDGSRAVLPSVAVDTSYLVRLQVTDTLGGVGQLVGLVDAATTFLDFIGDQGVVTIGKPARDVDNGYNGIRFDPRGTAAHTSAIGGLSTDALVRTLNGRTSLPDIFSWYNSSATVTGVLAIKLPVAAAAVNNTMLQFEIDGYEYAGIGGGWSIRGGAYLYQTPLWSNGNFTVEGVPPSTAVRLAYDPADGRAVILLGTTSTVWHYPAFTLSLRLSYTGSKVAAWQNPGNYSVTVYTAEPMWTALAMPVNRTPFQLSKNGAWIEEKIDTNLYRWTQITNITFPNINQPWSPLYFGTAPLPAKPTGATITSVSVTANNRSGWLLSYSADWVVDMVRPAAVTTSVSAAVNIVAYGTKP